MQEKKIKLSIVIPTYNRAQAIVARVSELLPQLDDSVELVIIDNCSGTVVEDLISREIPAASAKIRHLRNVANIGGNANICRCLEVGQGEWTWILGDDDFVHVDAVAKIISEIDSAQTTVNFINFSTSLYTHQEKKSIAGLRDFTEAIEMASCLSNLMFISSSCYRSAAARMHLCIAYHMTYSCASQVLVISLILAERAGAGRISSDRLVERTPCPPGHAWSSLVVVSGLPALLDVQYVDSSLSVFVARIMEDVRWRPFMTAGIHYIFNDQGRTVRFWWITLTKVFICCGIKMKARSLLLMSILPFASIGLTRKIIRSMISSVIDADVNHGKNRL